MPQRIGSELPVRDTGTARGIGRFPIPENGSLRLAAPGSAGKVMSVATSFHPESWERLTDLREEHARRARELDETWRLHEQGDATEEDLASAREREREAYRAWARSRVPNTGARGGSRVDPDAGTDDEIPQDV